MTRVCAVVGFTVVSPDPEVACGYARPAGGFPDDEVDDVMERMRAEQVRRIPVVEDGDRPVGIIAQADIAVDLGSERAEEVGETLESISRPAEPQR